MDFDWKHVLVEQLDQHWREQLRPRLDGLTDDEYLWEPVPGCWGLRRRGEATTPMAGGAGDHVLDFAWPVPEPEPVTTIAWRLGHVSCGVLGMRVASQFGGPPMDYDTVDWPATADGALAMLDEVYGQWIGGIRAMADARLTLPIGAAEGPYAEWPFAALMLHISREVIHHGAEVALLRDLHRAGAGGQAEASSLTRGAGTGMP